MVRGINHAATAVCKVLRTEQARQGASLLPEYRGDGSERVLSVRPSEAFRGASCCGAFRLFTDGPTEKSMKRKSL